MKKSILILAVLSLAFLTFFLTPLILAEETFNPDPDAPPAPEVDDPNAPGTIEVAPSGIGDLFDSVKTKLVDGFSAMTGGSPTFTQDQLKTKRALVLEEYNKNKDRWDSAIVGSNDEPADIGLTNFVKANKAVFTAEEIEEINDGDVSGVRIAQMLSSDPKTSSAASDPEQLDIDAVEAAIAAYNPQWNDITYDDDDPLGLGKDLKAFVDSHANAFTEYQLKGIRGENLLAFEWGWKKLEGNYEGADILETLQNNKKDLEESGNAGWWSSIKKKTGDVVWSSAAATGFAASYCFFTIFFLILTANLIKYFYEPVVKASMWLKFVIGIFRKGKFTIPLVLIAYFFGSGMLTATPVLGWIGLILNVFFWPGLLRPPSGSLYGAITAGVLYAILTVLWIFLLPMIIAWIKLWFNKVKEAKRSKNAGKGLRLAEGFGANATQDN